MSRLFRGRRQLRRLLGRYAVEQGILDAERLEAALGLEPGVVSPFGMIDPARREVQLIFDEEVLQQQILTATGWV